MTFRESPSSSLGRSRASAARLLLLVLSFHVVPLSSRALDAHPGEILTMYLRVNPETGAADSMGSLSPLAVGVDGADWLVLGSGPGRVGNVRKLWRYSPETGKTTLIAATDIPFQFQVGLNVVGRGAGTEAILVTGTSLFSVRGLLAVDVVTGAQRTLTNAVLQSGTPRAAFDDLLVADNGHILLPSSTRGVIILDSNGALVATSSGSLAIHGLAQAADGRILAVAPNGLIAPNQATEVLEVNRDTGELTPLGTVSGVGVRNAKLRLAIGADGSLFIASLLASGDSGVFRIAAGSFEATEMPLPEGFTLDVTSDLDIDALGDLLLVGKDRTVDGSGTPVVLRVPTGAGEATLALGGRSEPLNVSHFVPGARHTIYFTGNDNTRRDRVYRQDLRTGVVSLVTSAEAEGAVLTVARQVASDGEHLYVLDHAGVNQEDARLVQVDPVTGAQTLLATLGNRLFPRHMIFDPGSGDLFFSAWAGSDTCCGSVWRVTPVEGATPVRVAQAGFLGNPEGLRMAANGDLLIAGRTDDRRGIYRVNPVTGEQAVVTENPLLVRPYYLEVLDDGDLLIGDYGEINATRLSVLHWDQASGVVTEVLGPDSGTREEENTLRMIDLVQVPASWANPPGGDPPTLSAFRTAAGTLRVVWESSDEPWILQSAAEVPGDPWSDLPAAEPTLEEDNLWVVELPGDDPARFYRLREAAAGE